MPGLPILFSPGRGVGARGIMSPPAELLPTAEGLKLRIEAAVVTAERSESALPPNEPLPCQSACISLARFFSRPSSKPPSSMADSLACGWWKEARDAGRDP